MPKQKCLFMTYTSHEAADKVADGSFNELIIKGKAVVILYEAPFVPKYSTYVTFINDE